MIFTNRREFLRPLQGKRFYMQKHLIITVTGTDRVGFVEGVTKLVVDHGANVEQSRMARLGGEFAVLMLVSVEETAFDALRARVMKLSDEGHLVTTRATVQGPVADYQGFLPYTITVNGADHAGIIHAVTRSLAEQGINIETLDTGTAPAPMSGTPLFTMTATVAAPASISLTGLRAILSALGDKLNVDTIVAPYVG
jgi:glycine cleavage system transcriptional repressor